MSSFNLRQKYGNVWVKMGMKNFGKVQQKKNTWDGNRNKT